MTGRRLLIVNADDLGMGPEVDAGILRAHDEGIVTSASLMVHGSSVAEGTRGALQRPRLGLGLHVDLGEWALRAGTWHRVRGTVDLDDLEAVCAEVEAQVARFRRLTGRDPDHLDSHQHVHRDEPVRTAMRAIAAWLGVPLRHEGPTRYCGAFYGQGRRGETLPAAISAAALAALLGDLRPGATELCCHPAAAPPETSAYAEERVAELRALCDPAAAAAVRRAGVRLVRFGDLAPSWTAPLAAA